MKLPESHFITIINDEIKKKKLYNGANYYEVCVCV